MNENFIGKRVTELRLKKGVSEYKMSLDMGHSSSYINSIASGKSLPSLGEFLYMCEYFEITPKDFFDIDNNDPQPVRELYELIKRLRPEEIKPLVEIAKILSEK